MLSIETHIEGFIISNYRSEYWVSHHSPMTTKTTGPRRRMGRVAKSMEGILKMKRRMRIKSKFVL